MSKVVLVTGGSRGIGAACACVFASYGYDIVINYKSNLKEAELLRDKILGKYSVAVILVQADVSVEKEVILLMETIKESFSKIDVVVNNAGIAIDSDFLDKNLDTFKRVLDVNLLGTFLVCKYARKMMDKGAIVNVSSTNSIDSYYPFSMEYDVSKAGVNLLTKDLAVEFGPDIRVNAVAPGWVDTDMNSDLSDEFISEEKKKIILDRFADPFEIANVIYFLASDKASYLNGVIIPIDGGRK